MNKKKVTADDVYAKQMEAIEIEIVNKKWETRKLELQVRLLERLDKKCEEQAVREMLDSIMMS